ncbi:MULTISPECIES: hypothetical protein [unclassified Novosphingobium]|uniref:hypothetical protein n=1 Tax=unclassified Novosphingobium TaxID=2644732 RepID=UPI0025EB27D9|nr:MULTISPECIES: hypothetical protein [unclassified Novosphingobium]
MKDHAEVAVEAGGAAPPVIIRLTDDERRIADRAHVDAGIMPLAEYVRIYGREGSAE